MGHIEMKCYDIASIPGKVIYEDIKRTKNDTDFLPILKLTPCQFGQSLAEMATFLPDQISSIHLFHLLEEGYVKGIFSRFMSMSRGLFRFLILHIDRYEISRIPVLSSIRQDICPKFYTARFSGYKFYTAKVRNLQHFHRKLTV